ncbi:MAG: monovalent cation/H+ antiporter complex subunit F [Thermoanaerobaculia bacterium]
MLAAAMLAILVSMALLLVRAVKGPSVFDRILAVNSFGTKTVLLIAVLNFLGGRPEFRDLALVYAMMNFLVTIAVLRFSRFGDLTLIDVDEDEVARLEQTLEKMEAEAMEP